MGRQGRSFGTAAAEYERSRPPYPRDAVVWLVGESPKRVVDLGAGTGKLTEVLLELGPEVIAVEPDPGMRDRLAARLPTATAVDGSAEQIPLAEASVDAVVVAQAWHWFEHPAAAREIARVLRPGGTLGVVWNLRDESVPWIAAWGQLVHSDDHTQHPIGDTLTHELGDWFGPVERAQFGIDHELAPADLITLAASRSKVIALGEAGRDELLARVAALAKEHPELAGRDRVSLRYVTRCFRARRG